MDGEARAGPARTATIDNAIVKAAASCRPELEVVGRTVNILVVVATISSWGRPGRAYGAFIAGRVNECPEPEVLLGSSGLSRGLEAVGSIGSVYADAKPAFRQRLVARYARCDDWRGRQ